MYTTESYAMYDAFGSEGELLALLYEKLNLQYYLQKFNDTEGQWLEMIEAVQNGTLDWAIGGITMSVQRLEIVDFTTYIRFEQFTSIYSVYEDVWMSWQNVLIPLQKSVWGAVILTVILISSLFYITVKLTYTKERMHFMYFIQGSVRMLVEQALPYVPKVLKARFTTMLLICLWFMTALIITNAYKSKLTSSLIGLAAEEPDTIDELVESGFRFQISDEDSSVLQDNLRSSADTKFLETLNRSSNDSDFCTSLLKTIGHKVAVIEEETHIQYMVQEKCRKLMSLDEQADLRVTRQALFPSQHGWPLQLATPYRVTFNSIFSRLHAAGLFIKWNNDYAALAQRVPKSHEHRVASNSKPKFTLTSMLGLGIIWALGMLAATLVFIGELLRGR